MFATPTTRSVTAAEVIRTERGIVVQTAARLQHAMLCVWPRRVAANPEARDIRAAGALARRLLTHVVMEHAERLRHSALLNDLLTDTHAPAGRSRKETTP